MYLRDPFLSRKNISFSMLWLSKSPENIIGVYTSQKIFKFQALTVFAELVTSPRGGDWLRNTLFCQKNVSFSTLWLARSPKNIFGMHKSQKISKIRALTVFAESVTSPQGRWLTPQHTFLLKNVSCNFFCDHRAISAPKPGKRNFITCGPDLTEKCK